MSIFEPEQRLSRLAGTHNLRDTGGYLTADGHRTRWGVLLRSASVDSLEEASRAALLASGLHTVIDLRGPEEISHWPNVFATVAGIQYRNLPLMNPYGDHSWQTLAQLYCAYLDERGDDLRAIFESLAAPDTAPVLVHCFIGKDRTGLTIALALSAVGVPDETVADDYALSFEALTELYVVIRANIIAQGETTDSFDRYTESQRETMLETLAYLREHYGDAAAYLRHIGVSDEAITRLEMLLVEQS